MDAAAKSKGGEGKGWYSQEQLRAYRQWLAEPPAPFWTAPPAPPAPAAETATDDEGDAPADLYVVLDSKDPEV